MKNAVGTVTIKELKKYLGKSSRCQASAKLFQANSPGSRRGGNKNSSLSGLRAVDKTYRKGTRPNSAARTATAVSRMPLDLFCVLMFFPS